MVRLKPTASPPIEVMRTWFQFHNGSIKALEHGQCADAPLWFQFHNGSIKAQIIGSGINIAAEFQFHNGSIKAAVFTAAAVDFEPVSIPQWFD